MHDSSYYSKLGFKSGLEIHQRLATSHKLFCACNPNLTEEDQIGRVERVQRAVAGETGAVDASTRFESGKRRNFIYNSFRDATCLVDIDEEPPHDLNKEALDVALQIVAIFDSKIPDEIEVMRKGVVDGSDPSGFQRTMQVGYNGYMELNRKNIPIPTIFLEEESSGIVSQDENVVVYNTDRLGIPLVEIDTDPVLSTPQEVKEVAYKIGMLLRLTGKVQRGIGTIRQDVNLSIKDGARVEIKGFQELDIVDAIIENEVERQLNLLKLRKELLNRHAQVYQPIDVTSVFGGTSSKIIKENTKNGGVVYGVRLEGFEGIIGHEINPNRRLGSEISDYAKVSGIKGIIHSDEEMEKYSISQEEIDVLKQRLDIKGRDAFMLVSGQKDASKSAIERAIIRAKIALKEVPSETRMADSKNLTTRFLRPIAGGSRMYPETDSKPMELDAGKYEKMKVSAPNIEATIKRLRKQINNDQLAEQMLKSPLLPTYNLIVEKSSVDPKFVAAFLLEKMKEMRRSGLEIDALTDDVLVYVFTGYANGDITKNAVEEIIKQIPRNVDQVERIVADKKLTKITGKGLKKLLEGFKEKDKGMLIKQVMSKYRLNVDGEELNSLLK
ncbi:MAG: Glu-tRNA(Gln) amidotransferase subunit GatE [Candidatus Micrarchaeota archaeon]|nr:Glu-tRNA(Gln) amidotransferase subunit GatE [Candidatus Micrarchaeota archaeon]MDE1847360.1 Glu-tRNA(Gln) amidotransferase subunit GatE [Candidatus Micrarchaeota archaeon]MDE1863975.1 Glu-tRNA(Gln) amidotransferase subunit GatE [Candidatus Micrarchaeota archaeon]